MRGAVGDASSSGVVGGGGGGGEENHDETAVGEKRARESDGDEQETHKRRDGDETGSRND